MTATQVIGELPGPRGLPGLGNSLQLRPSSFHLNVERWAREYGPVYRYRIGRTPVVAFTDPEVMNAILRDRPSGYRRWSILKEVFEEMGPTGVFAAEGDDWKRQRRLAVTALNSNHLNRYFEVIRRSTGRLHRRLASAASSGAVVDIQRLLMSFTVDVTSALTFGQDINTLEHSEDELPRHVERFFETFARRITAPVPYWRYVRTPADRAFDRSRPELETAIAGFIEAARTQLGERPELHEQPENFLQGMVAAQEADESFSDEEIAGNCLTMLLAGEDTTAHTISWATWYLAREPAVQERLAREARERLGDAQRPPDYEGAAGLEYGEAVLREVLRLKPAATFILLEPLEERVIAGVRIPAGTRLMLITRAAGVREQSFGAAEQFDPERWLNGTGTDRAHETSSFLPFGAGPRFCPGRNLALLEGKAALAMIARNFELELDGSSGAVEERFHFTMGPHNLRLRVRERV